MNVVSQEEKNVSSRKKRGANVSANEFLCLGASSGDRERGTKKRKGLGYGPFSVAITEYLKL